MSAKRKGLGRSLDALLGNAQPQSNLASQVVEDAELRYLAIDHIKPGRYQPRKDIDQNCLEELAASIRSQGILQPIAVQEVSANHYEIIAGERRWRAAQLAGLTEIPAMIKDVTPEDAMALALIENIQREDLNPIEEALALKRLIDEFAMTHQEAADAVGRSRAAVSNLLRLNELTPEVKTLLVRGDLEMGHARALLALSESTLQIQMAKVVVAKNLSVRETEALVKHALTGAQPKNKPSKDPDVVRLEQNLSEKLGAKIAIQHQQTGKGRVVIQYNSLDELDGILAHIN